MKEAGLFFISEADELSEVDEITTSIDINKYLECLSDTDIYEISGKIDFEKATRFLYRFIKINVSNKIKIS